MYSQDDPFYDFVNLGRATQEEKVAILDRYASPNAEVTILDSRFLAELVGEFRPGFIAENVGKFEDAIRNFGRCGTMDSYSARVITGEIGTALETIAEMRPYSEEIFDYEGSKKVAAALMGLAALVAEARIDDATLPPIPEE